VHFNWFKSRQERSKVVLICILLTLVTLGLYWPVTGFDFINFDDAQYVTTNPNVQAGYSIKSVIWAFTTHHASNWHPVTWLSHILDCRLYGLHAGGHHFTSVLFHVANALLLFGLSQRLTGATWRSALVAALFAWHPLHVESVAWVSERKDVLSTFFALLTLWAYWFYVKAPNRWRYGLTLLCFVCGLMSKPMLVTLPLLLLLLDYWPLGRNRDLKGALIDKTRQTPLRIWTRLVVEKVPFFILAAISSSITYWAQIILRDQGGLHLTFGERAANALNSYTRYIGKLIWPENLSVFYPYPHHLPVVQIIGAGLLLAAFSILAFRYCRSRPHLIVGWLWFLVALVPVIGLIQVGGQSLADRYTYIPSIGLFMAFAWESPYLLGTGNWARWICGIAAMLILTSCLVITSRQLRYWKNSATLFTDAIEVTRDNAVAQCNLGEALLAQGNREDALVHLNEALRIEPNYVIARNVRGDLFYEQGKFREAAAELNAALALRPGFDLAHNNLGKALLALGRRGEAEAQFRAAVKCDPDSGANLVNLGLFLAKQGRLDEAVGQYQAALRLAPNCDAENALGSALESQGKVGQAVEHYKMALKINPDFAEAHCNLGAILNEQGNFAEAVKHFAAAIKIKPDFAEAHYDWGNALIGQDKPDDAAMQYAEAVRLKPDYMEACFNLGNVMLQRRQWPEALKYYAAAAHIQPDFIEAQVRMAMVLRFMGNGRDAIAHYRTALQLNARSVTALQGLAWVLATNPDSKLRNGTEAVGLATQATESEGASDPIVWDTLAAAYAEIGQFEEAVKTANKAINLATVAGYKQLADQIQNRRQMYEQGQAFHETP